MKILLEGVSGSVGGGGGALPSLGLVDLTFWRCCARWPLIGGPVEKMSFFQMVPKSYLSVVMHSNRCEYDILKVSLEKIDHNLPIGRVKDENVPH